MRNASFFPLSNCTNIGKMDLATLEGMMRRLAILIAVLLVSLSGLGAPAYAGVPHAKSARPAVEQNAIRLAQSKSYSLDQAVARVRREFGGKIIRAETRRSNGRPVHHIKVLSDNGRVRTVRVDGVTGRIL